MESSAKEKWKCRFCETHISEPKKRGAHVANCNLRPDIKLIRSRQIKSRLKIPMSEETKKKISESRKRFLRENYQGDPSFYGIRLRKSNHEELVEKKLIESGIVGWISQYRNGTYTYDIAFPTLKIDIEIDGGTHKLQRIIEKDKIRDEWSISQGWRILRVSSLLIKHDVNQAVLEIKNFIGKENIEILKKVDLEKIPISENSLKKRIYKEKVQENKLKKLEFIEKRKSLLLSSEIDFSKFGWIKKASEILEISPQKVSGWMQTHLPEIYKEKCFITIR